MGFRARPSVSNRRQGELVSVAKRLVVIGGAAALSACAMQSPLLYSGQPQPLYGRVPTCMAPTQPIGMGGQWHCMTPAQIQALTQQSEQKQQQQGAQRDQALVSSPTLPGERPEYHQSYVQGEIARYHQAIQQCSQLQANGTLGINNGRYQDCMTEAREQFQWDQQNEQGFAARDAVAHEQASAEAQAVKTGQVTPLMLQLCHAFGVYGPQNCVQAYPSIAAHLP